MASTAEREIRRHMVVLEDVVARCRSLLNQRDLQEADLRDALCTLKFAHADAERGLAGVEREEWQTLRAHTVTTVAMLMKPLREMNPELTSWERARDPNIPVNSRHTRSGRGRVFDHQRIVDVYAEIKRKVWEKLPDVRPRGDERLEEASRTSERSGFEKEQVGRVMSDPGRPGLPTARDLEPNYDRGPPGGRFRLMTTDDESGGDRTYRSGGKERQKRNLKNQKYGHRENDMEFFKGAFQDEISALQNLHLGDDFRYPSDEAFARYFPEFDFVKAMRGSSLRKWDGTVRDYPGFKHNYYRMVYVQREHYMHKILALEQMVPDNIKTELFHGLQYTVEDLGQRLQRLEDRFGGQEKQMKQIVQELQRLQGRGKIPYPELRVAVEDVNAFLNRPSTLVGAGETLVVLLKKVIPKHFRTQYNDMMFQWGKPRTGNSFVEYMRRRLTYEIDESEGLDKREPIQNKKQEEGGEKKHKTLGKLYQSRADETASSWESKSEGSSDEGECHVAKGKPKELPRCRCCQQGNHYLHNCRKFFIVLMLKERVAFAKQHAICCKCLRYEHQITDCPFRIRPDCRFCAGKDHHYLLCPGTSEAEVHATEGQEITGSGFENIGELIARKNVSTLQLVANIEGSDGRLIPINILPDTGSSHNILDKRMADKAGITGFKCKYRVTGHGGHVTEHEAICGEVTLVNPRVTTEKHKVRFYGYDNPCGPFFPEDWGKMKNGWPHLKGLDIPSPVEGEPITMILGCENLQLFETIKPTTLRGPTDPVARLTRLGWMVGGRTFPEPSTDVTGESRIVKGDVGIASGVEETEVSCKKTVRILSNNRQPRPLVSLCRLAVTHDPAECHQEYENLKSNLKRVWELETEEEVSRLTNSHFPAVKTNKELRADAMIADSLKQFSNGDYQTSLLWTTNRRPRNNYVEAKRAYLNWERKLASDDLTKDAYHLAMSNWILNEFVENTEHEVEGPQNFLTNFMVMKPGAGLEKARLVVNGARKFRGEALNDFLEPGSNLMNDLGELILRIRRHKYVVCCDLQNMFLNIKVAPEDRKYLRMFYRKDSSEPLKVYQFTVHAFGLASSPCVAMSVVRAHARKHGDRWPIAEKAIRENSLVDDIWLLSDHKAEIERGIQEVVELMREMNISVHKWGSNCPELLEEIPEDKRARVIKLAEKEDTAIKALGVVWDTERDVFLFPNGPPLLEPWTLRTMTSSAGQLFDPLVLLGPTTTPVKLLIQNAWRYQSEWDEPLPECMSKKMTLYCKNQEKLAKVQIPRHLGGQDGQGKLIIFTDSSNLAQAAAAYWVTETNGRLDSNLVASKTKVTGMRQHEHIGRLELVAAVMGVNLAVKIAVAYRMPMQEVLYFTDSMSVLYWLTTPAALSAYTGHRVAKINERSVYKQWNYVNTSENPSDLPTRGLRAEDLAECELWWKGPAFLRHPPHRWPAQPKIRAPDSAAAEVRTAEEFTKNIIMMNKSEAASGPLCLVERLLKKGFTIRKAMYALVIVSEAMYEKFGNRKFNLTFGQIETMYIKKEQRIVFAQLCTELQKHQRVSTLIELEPRLDEQGVLRVAAGLGKSLYHSWETAYPILLHEKMQFAKELLEYTHSKSLGHTGGINTLMSQVRTKYHVVGGKKGAARVLRTCFPCSKKSWKPLKRKLPEFHSSRLANKGLRAFLEIGVDHAGPFLLKQGRGTVEGYILVIACCATRAVNLEMSLSTGADHVLAALQRHVGVYGSPSHINSDQGVGFVKARRLMRERADRFTTEGWDHENCPKWHLNIPYSPTWSGHVEAMVKITKEALRKLHSGPTITKLTADEFYTQLKRVQGYINMRPLLQVSADQLPLTPADFIGTGNAWLSSLVMESEGRGASGYRFEQLEKIRRELWDRFRKEYLTSLRRQGGVTSGLPEVGDLVLVSDVPSWKGDGWPVGKIVGIRSKQEEPRLYEIEVVPTEELRRPPQLINNQVRLKLKKKTILRNYRKIGLLPKITIDASQAIHENDDDVVRTMNE